MNPGETLAILDAGISQRDTRQPAGAVSFEGISLARRIAVSGQSPQGDTDV